MRNCWLITVLLISLMLVGCRPMQMAGGSSSRAGERETTSRQVDSVFIHVTDSVFIREKGDSVFVIKYRTVYRDRWRDRTDTLRVCDSVYVEEPVLVAKPLSGWQHFQLWTGRIALIVLLALCARRVLKRYLKPF